MKNLYLTLALTVFAIVCNNPAYAQQAYGQNGFVPLNQASQPGFTPLQMPASQGIMNGQPQYQNSMTNNSQYMQPMASNGIISQPNGYTQSNQQALSPYEQQELALKESRMLQELEDMKAKRENHQGFRHSNGSNFESGYVAKNNGSKGKFKKTLGKLGSLVKRTAVAAAPAGAAVGTMFAMRAAFGPPATFMPVATPGGTAFIPVGR